MSSRTARLPLARARKAADELVTILRDSCERIEIAGSIRRGAATVGDIEVIAIPLTVRQDDMFGKMIGERDLLAEATQRLLIAGRLEHRLNSKGQRAWGTRERRALFRLPNGALFPVDFFWSTRDTWGITLALRTGPAGLSNAMVTSEGVRSRSGREGLLRPNLRVKDGLRHRVSGVLIPCREESDFLQYLNGVPERPEDRT